MTTPSGILEAFQTASVTTAPRTGRTFQETIFDFAEASQTEVGVLTNKRDILCPRGCRSIILKSGVGRLVEQSRIEMDAPGHPIDPVLEPLPAPPTLLPWWSVTPSPMAFENVGFSRPVVRNVGNLDTVAVSPKSVKFLICADCDVGPLGWCEEGGTEFLLACSRVRYAVPY